MDPAQRSRLGGSTVEVTRLGMGCASLGNLYAPISDEVASATVAAALDEGIRHFDTAPYYGYGLSESRLGAALRARGATGVVVSSKVGRLLVPRPQGPRSDQGFVDALPFDPVFDYGYDAVLHSVEESLRRLGRDRIDVALIHDLGRRTHGADHEAFFEDAMEGGMRARASLREQGVIGAMGLGVNEWEICALARERADFDCFLLAGRYTLLEQGALRFLDECAERGTSIVIGGPYNSGILAGSAAYDYEAPPAEICEKVEALRAVCSSHGVALAAVALQFPLLHPAVSSVIPGARSPEEIRANAAHLRSSLPESLWTELRESGLIHPDAPLGETS